MLRMTCDESYLPTVKKTKTITKKQNVNLFPIKYIKPKISQYMNLVSLRIFFFFYKKNYKTKCNILNLVTNIHSKLLRNRNTTVVLSKIHTPKLM